MTPAQFIATWQNAGLNEEQAAHSWFNDLCDLVGHPRPMGELDGLTYAFEHRIETGKADAYYENHFCWEFKTAEHQLNDAMRQALGYSMYLKTPPLLVVSAFNVIRIRTNFLGMESVQREIPYLRTGRTGLRRPGRTQAGFHRSRLVQHRQEPRRRHQRNRRPVPGRQQRHGRFRLRR